MLQKHTINFNNLYRPYDLQGKDMLSADKADRFIMTCLTEAGSSGHLKPGASVRILE